MDLWNEIENRKTTEKINKTKSWVSENINKIDKTLARLTKKNITLANDKIYERGVISLRSVENSHL